MSRVERLPVPERLNLALLLLASAVSAGALWGASHAPHPGLLVACAVVFSFSANTLFSLLHEAVHGVFSRDRRRNEAAGLWAAAWFPTSLSVQRAFHLTHHRNNRGPNEQFDYLRPTDSVVLKYAQWYAILTGLYWAVTVVGVLVHALVPWLTRLAVLRDRRSNLANQTSARPYLDALDEVDGARARLEVVLALIVQAGLVVALDLSLPGWLACYAAFALQWSGLQYADHAFSPLDPREGAWNLRAPRPWRWAFLNYHDHLAHHREPRASWIHLPALVGEDEVRPHYFAMWLRMWAGPRPLPADDLTGAPAPRPTFGAPRGLDAWAGALSLLAVTLAFVALYGGASALSAHVPWRVPLALPGEPFVPFVPAWAPAYLSLDLLLLLVPFVVRDARAVVAFGLTMIAETVVAAACFLLLPGEDVFAARHVTGWAAPLFQAADLMNLERNFAPSLHVAYSATAALWCARATTSRGWRAGFVAWAAAIAASTLLLHEHYVVDVLLGLLLAAGAARVVGPRAARDEVWTGLLVEWALLLNMLRFGLRHRRYLVIALALYLQTGLSRRRRVVRTGFVVLQLVDDLLDGDRACSGDPRVRVDAIADRLRRPAAAPPASFDDLLADALREDLAAVVDRRGPGAPLDRALELIEVMKRDHERMRARRVLGREEVRAQLERTFGLSLDLMLVAAGSDVRARDVPALVRALGWCSVVRDLEEDLARGLINVPADEWPAIERAVDPAARREALRAWVGRHAGEARALVDAAEAQVAALEQGTGRRVLLRFARSIRRYLPPGLTPAADRCNVAAGSQSG